MDFRKKPSLRKLWREKANMQMSSYNSVQPVHRGRFSSLLGRVILMFPIVDRRYGSTLLALYGSGSVQRSSRLPPYKDGKWFTIRCIAYLVQVANPDPCRYRTVYALYHRHYLRLYPLTDSAEDCTL